MPVTEYALTYNFADLTGDDLIPGHTIAWVETNLGASEAVVDTSTGGKVLVGSKRMGDKTTLNGTISLPPTNSTDTIPTDFQYRVWCEYQTIRGGKVTKGRWTSGWFSFIAAANLKDIIEEFYAPPTYLTQLTEALDAHEAALEADLTATGTAQVNAVNAASADAQAAINDDVTAAQDARVGAEAARFGSELAQAAAEALVVSDLGTTDGQTRALIEATSSQTRLALDGLFGVIGLDTDGAFYLTNYAGIASSPIQYDTDLVPYIATGA